MRRLDLCRVVRHGLTVRLFCFALLVLDTSLLAVGLIFLIVRRCLLVALLDLLGLRLFLFLQVVEVVFKGAALVQQELEVALADKHLVYLWRNLHRRVGIEYLAVVRHLVEVLKALHDQQTQTAEVHLLQVVVLDDERVEVVTCHLVEQQARTHRVGGVEQDEHLRLVVVLFERRELALECLWRGVVAQACAPQHATGIAAATFELAAGVQLLDNAAGGRGDVGFGIALQHVLEGLLELVIVALRDIRQRVDEHELGHNLGQGVLAHHLGIRFMHCLVVVVEVVGVGLGVHPLLLDAHPLQVLDVVGVKQRLAFLGFGKVAQNHVAINRSTVHRTLTHVHQVHVVIGVQAIGVVGIVGEQTRELYGCSLVVLEFVLEDDTHVVQALLDNLVRGLDLLFGLGNLLEVVLLVVRVFGTTQRGSVDGY